MMEVEFEDFSDKEEILQERAAKITSLKKQYEEFIDNKGELSEFAKEGKRDVENTSEDKYQEIVKKDEEDKPDLGFTVNWNAMNERTFKQIVGLKRALELTPKEAKQWFYMIRREEIKLKKAQEIL